MTYEPPLRTLGEMSINFDTRRKPVKEFDRVAGPFPYYGASGVVDHVDGYIFDGVYVLVAEDGENLRTRNTPIAFLATGKFWVNNHAHILQGNDVASTKYLEYALLNADISPYLSGAVMPKLTQGNLNQILLPCPPRGVQEKIVGLLGVLDERIDLLRQTSTTLEAISQVLFKSWFVDFDPVRSKAEGREPEGIGAAIAALFPSEFEESELGLIPKGWTAGAFGSIALQSKGNVNPLKFPEELYNHYSLPAFDSGMMPIREPGQEIKSNKTPVPHGAVLISKLNPHIPRIWFTGEVGTNAVCSTEFLVWTPLNNVPAEYIYCLATSVSFNTSMKQLVTGTSNSHQRVKPDYVAAIKAIVPPPELTAAFGVLVEPLLRRVLENRSIAYSLGQLRDTLLPNLMSGKLRLPEAEAVIEEAIA